LARDGTTRSAHQGRRRAPLLSVQHYCGAERRFLPLGPYDESGVHSLSLIQARDRATQLSALYRSGVTALHAHLEREREAKERIRMADEDAASAVSSK
jgi:hypothetical protein